MISNLPKIIQLVSVWEGYKHSLTPHSIRCAIQQTTAPCGYAVHQTTTLNGRAVQQAPLQPSSVCSAPSDSRDARNRWMNKAGSWPEDLTVGSLIPRSSHVPRSRIRGTRRVGCLKETSNQDKELQLVVTLRPKKKNGIQHDHDPNGQMLSNYFSPNPSEKM